MRGELTAIARKRLTIAKSAFISQWSGPLTASPLGEAFTKERSIHMKNRITRITAALAAAALLAGCGSISSKDGGYYATEAAAQENYN